MATYTQTITVQVATPGATPSYPTTAPDSSGIRYFLVNESPTLSMHIGQSASVQVYGSRQPSIASSIDAASTGNPATEPDRIISAAEGVSVSWASGNSSVATVSANAGNIITVTAVASGSTTVVATYNDPSASDASITVEIGSPGLP